MLITAPQIGRLVARPRLWANRQIEAGAFGAVVRRGNLLGVELEAVELHIRLRFSRDQLIAGGLRIPDPKQEEGSLMATMPRTTAPTPAELVERIKRDLAASELRLAVRAR